MKKKNNIINFWKQSKRSVGSRLNRRAKYMKFALKAWKEGVAYSRVDRVAKAYTLDYFDFKLTSKEDKEWAYQHGFSSYKMNAWYGITKENYKDYISDFDFYNPRNYIRNIEIMSMYEHKLCTYMVLQPFLNDMPRHYYYISESKIKPLNVKKITNITVSDVLELIKEKPIAAKACKGGHGVGFIKLECKNEDYYANNVRKTEDEMLSIIRGLEDYIITDYEKPHQFYQNLCGADTFAVIRVTTVFDETDGPQLTNALIRLGCKGAGITTDHEGTIYVGLTLEEGKAFKPLIRVADNLYETCLIHPDTCKSLENFVVPNWDKLKKLVLSVSKHVSITPYLVMDIIPTQEGFSILEINSHGQMGNMEPFYPFCANKYNRRVFNINN